MYYISQPDRANHDYAFGTPESTRSATHTSKIQLFPFKENISFSPEKKISDTNGITSTTMASHSTVYNTASHTPIKTPPTLSNSFTGYQGSVNSYSLSRGLMEKKSPKPKNVCINLTHFEDADIEEFNEKIEKPSKVAFKSTNAPFESPKKKSLLGITELHSSPLRLMQTMDVLSLEDNKTTESIGSDDETDIQQPEGLDDNMDDISNLSMIHNFDARFEQSRYRAESIRRKHRGERSKATLMNDVVIDNLLEFMDCGDLVNFTKILTGLGNIDQYRMKIRQLLRELIIRGMDDQEQYSYWNASINFRYLKEHHSTSFNQNFVRKCAYIKDIKMDLDRTLPEYEKYSTEEGKNELLKVLVAVSNSNKGVGYIQGLNSIAGVFLFYLKEEQAFWATLYILEKLKIKDLLKEDFQTIYTLNYQFKTFLESYQPEIVEHLAINLEYITTPWFITLFSYFLPLPKIVKLWNFFFLKGIGFFIQFGLAIFSHYKKEIMEMEPDEVPTFLKAELRELADDDDRLFEKALEFKVTKRLMLDLLSLYQQGKPKAKLCKDGMTGKLKWEVIPGTLTTKLSIPLKANEKLDTYPADSKIPTMNTQTFASENDLQSKDSPFKFQKFFNAIAAGIPGTLKNMFSKNKNSDEVATPRDLSHRSEKPESTENLSQKSNSPEKSKMYTPPKRIPIDMMIDSSPENIKSHDKTPHIAFFHDSYSRNNRGMLESLDTEDAEEQNILYTVRTEADESNNSYYNPQKSARAKSLFMRKPIKLGRSFEGKESPRQISLSKFYEIARMIQATNPDYEHRILTGISLPKIESTTTVDDVSINRRVISSSPHHVDRDASVAYFSTGYSRKY